MNYLTTQDISISISRAKVLPLALTTHKLAYKVSLRCLAEHKVAAAKKNFKRIANFTAACINVSQMNVSSQSERSALKKVEHKKL